jgi:hypothetical protein
MKNIEKIYKNVLLKGIVLGMLAGSAHLITLHILKPKLLNK